MKLPTDQTCINRSKMILWIIQEMQADESQNRHIPYHQYQKILKTLRSYK